MSFLGRLVAVVADDILTEYRKLQRAAPPATGDEVACLPSVTAADTERAASWDHDKRAPAIAASERPFGFRGAS